MCIFFLLLIAFPFLIFLLERRLLHVKETCGCSSPTLTSLGKSCSCLLVPVNLQFLLKLKILSTQQVHSANFYVCGAITAAQSIRMAGSTRDLVILVDDSITENVGMLMESKFRTSKKEEADLFFVPAYVKCVRMLGGLNDKEINQTYVKVLSQMPYFRRSGGRDHIFVFPSGAGAHLFRSWSTFINRSIILTPEGDRTDKKDTTAFNTWKDIIIPGNVDDAMTKNGQPDVQPLPLSKRKYLANYLGRAQGKAGRLKLIDLSKQYPDKLECPDLKFSGTEKFGRTTYFEHLRNAKFCLAPRGESSWTLRFYESFFVECVPVLLSDHAELPFQNVIDYAQVSIKWPSSRIGAELLDYLASIPDRDIEGMIARGRKIRCLFVYGPDSAPCSAVKGILWELQRKVRHFQQSTETFWLHNGSVVNRELVHFSSWRAPMPLP